MKGISSVQELKVHLDELLNANESALLRLTRYESAVPKCYLIESNRREAGPPNVGRASWTPLDSRGWFRLDSGDAPNSVFLDASDTRVWRLFTTLDTHGSERLVADWVDGNTGLDRCWLTRNMLLHWQKKGGYTRRGIGVSFENGITPEERRAQFSFKLWNTPDSRLPATLSKALTEVEKNYAVYSARWEWTALGRTQVLAEVYSEGSITINRAAGIDEAFSFVSDAASKYKGELEEITKAVHSSQAPVELAYSQPVSVKDLSAACAHGAGDLKLWLTPVENGDGFARLHGVDTHTWDRVLLDVHSEAAFLQVPAGGCLNAIPRIATLLSQQAAGNVAVYHDGVPFFT